MKKILVSLALLCLGINAYSQDTNIVKSGNYTVNGTSTLEATGSIVLQPVSHIQAGSTFSMVILGSGTPPTTSGPIPNPNIYSYSSIALSDRNYVLTRVYQVDSISSFGDIGKEHQVLENIVYFDGLGRAEQQIAAKASKDRHDMITYMEYDGLGRTAKQWLAYEEVSGSSGSFRSSARTNTQSFYKSEFANEFSSKTVEQTNPYSEFLFDGLDPQRAIKQAAPGVDWAMGEGHEIEMEYGLNAADEVRFFSVSFSGGNTEFPLLSGGTSFYSASTLTKVVTKDENHSGTSKLNTTEEFTDTQGRVVLKRTYALINGSEEAHDTYYVYDTFGNLSFVLPPLVETSDGVSTTELNDICYQYRYDKRNRLIQKRIPGRADWESIVYDKLDRPILTQDPNLKAGYKWLFTKYDVLGRVVYTGLKSSSSSRTVMQSAADAHGVHFEERGNAISEGGTTIYYTDASYPILDGSDEILTVSYYDSYVDMDGLSLPSQVYNESVSNDVEGLSTVSKVKVLETSDWITTVSGYDQDGRIIFTSNKNQNLETYNTNQLELDFVGNTINTSVEHTNIIANNSTMVQGFYTYDHRDRPLSYQESINNNVWTTIYSCEYGPLGQQMKKHIGNSIQTIHYEYNIRGWLTSVNDPMNLANDLFGYRITYNDPTSNIQGFIQWEYIQHLLENGQ